MDNELRHPLTDLTAGSMLRVYNGEGRAIVVFEGDVWITQHDDQRDFVLSGGESFSIDRPGLTLVEALRDSKLLLVDARSRRDTLPSSFELQRWAREQRTVAIADSMRRGAQTVREAVARWIAHLAPRAAPRAMTVCTAVR